MLECKIVTSNFSRRGHELLPTHSRVPCFAMGKPCSIIYQPPFNLVVINPPITQIKGAILAFATVLHETNGGR